MTIYTISNPAIGNVDYVVTSDSDLPAANITLPPWIGNITRGDLNTATNILNANIAAYMPIINDNLHVVHYETNAQGHIIIRPVNANDNPNDQYQVTSSLTTESKICQGMTDVTNTKIQYTQNALNSVLLNAVGTTNAIPLMSGKRKSTGTQTL